MYTADLVVEAPLTYNEVRSRILALLHHRSEVVLQTYIHIYIHTYKGSIRVRPNLLVLVELIVSFLGGDVEFMLGLGLGRLERAGQDAYTNH